jgi:hypothetical protein
VRDLTEIDAKRQSGAGALILGGPDAAGVPVPKLVSYGAMFVVLSLIDFTYLQAFTAPGDSGTVVLELPQIAKFVFLTAWPFAAMAVVDDRWSGEDGARIAIAAFITPAAYWFAQCGVGCLAAIMAAFVPFVASAAIGHAIGAWHRPRARDV